ncbi:MAG: arsinothricin resistance N-acetyltransferase ArsN1 family A [Baekduia sp.]
MTVVIRPAAPDDVGAMTEIYNAGIAGRAATFEEELREPADLTAWLDGTLPVLVAEDAGEVVGFARVKPFSQREVFAGVGDHGVYVAPGRERQGIGRALLDALAEAAAAQGLWKLTSRIFSTNTGSIAAHVASGFRIVGTQERHAKLDGEWRDVVLVERLIGEASCNGPRQDRIGPKARS